MDEQPIISVVMPCFNAAHTLGLALASLRVQTCQSWECIVVDDGSVDEPLAIIEQIGDARIRYIQLRRNYGRSVARQTAVEACRGLYVTKLDADDWLYPHKLESQLSFMECEPTAALVSSPVTLVDDRDHVLGLRGRTSCQRMLYAPLDRLSLSAIALAPVMLRAEIAAQYEYDARLRRSEDSDHTLQILWQHQYGVLPESTYVYRLFRDSRKRALVQGYMSRTRMLWKYRAHYPIDVLRETMLAVMKLLAVAMFYDEQSLASTLGRRSQAPTLADRLAYEQARVTVIREWEALFGTSIEN